MASYPVRAFHYLWSLGLATVTVALALGFRLALGPALDSPTLIIFSLPILLSSYYGGLSAGILATLLSILGSNYFLLSPIGSFAITSHSELLQEVILGCTGLVISIICEALHRAQLRAEKAEHLARDGQLASERLAAVVLSSEDAIISKTLDGIVTSWNAASERIFGYSAAEMIGQSITKVIPTARLDEEMMILAKLRQGMKVEHYETRRLRRDGALIEVSISVSPIRDGAGVIVGASKIARDITEKTAADATAKALREELAHASRLSAMGEMSAAIAHELNQPIAAIGNYLSAATVLMAKGTLHHMEFAREAVQKAKDQGIRAGAIIANLRSLVERRELPKTWEDINELAEEAINLAVSSAPNGGVTMTLAFDHSLPPVEVNRVQIQQVLFNLCRNSLEAMKTVSQRQLVVRTGWDGSDFIAVTIEDSGPGLPAEIADRLFQPFVTTKDDGMGMGLRISHTIVEAHGGKLSLCDDPHEGTCFKIKLPADRTLSHGRRAAA